MAGLASLISDGRMALLGLFITTQVLYLASILLIALFYSWPVDLVKPGHLSPDSSTYPPVLLFYPVLRELEETMRTTFHALDKMEYPRDRYRIVAIPNHDDQTTIAALRRLQESFPWLEVFVVPPTSHSSWNTVWEQWDKNPKVYWWHTGKRARVGNCGQKKTRQLVYAFYNVCPAAAEDTLISYIDADSAPPLTTSFSGPPEPPNTTSCNSPTWPETFSAPGQLHSTPSTTCAGTPQCMRI